MRVHDEYIPEEEYAVVPRRVPEPCVELFLEHDGAVLLCRRTRAPAKGEWFWPGSRLYKGEALADAARRVGREELGIEVELGERLGVYSHVWDTSAVEGADSRHTVNVVFRAVPTASSPDISLDDQHDAYRFVDGPEPGLHPYVVRYLEDAGYGGD